MSLRTRIAGVAGLAVALAVLAAAIGLYLAVRSDLRGQIDESLNQRAQGSSSPPPAAARERAGAGRLARRRAARRRSALPAALRARGRAGPLPRAVQPARFGGASGYVQFVSAAGAVDAPRGQGTTPQIPPNARERRSPRAAAAASLSDRTVKGTDLRVLTVGTPAPPAARAAP